MKKAIVLAVLLLGCKPRREGEIDYGNTKKMTMELSKHIKVMKLPQFNNTCIAYAWIGDGYGGPVAFTVPCDGMPTIPAPCVEMGSLEKK